MSRRPTQWAAAVLVTLSLTALAAQASVDDTPTPCGDLAQIQQWIDGLNAKRSEASPCDTYRHVSSDVGSAATSRAGALRLESRLEASAQELALSLAQQGGLSHVDLQGRSLGQRLQRVGYRPAVAAENLSAGQQRFDEVLDAWMGSPSHCANLMRGDVTDVGIACVQSEATAYQWFWVVQFGRSQGR